MEAIRRCRGGLIIAHVEAIDDPATLISEIRESDTMVGLVLNPDTESNAILPYLSDLDLVLVMSVVPGKGGQSFMPEVENKVREFRAAIDGQISNGGEKDQVDDRRRYQGTQRINGGLLGGRCCSNR